jgi:hypothetical protein
MAFKFGGGSGNAEEFAGSMSGPASAAEAGLGEVRRSAIETTAAGYRQAAEVPQQLLHEYATMKYHKAYIEGLTAYRAAQLGIRQQNADTQRGRLNEQELKDAATQIYHSSLDAGRHAQLIFKAANQKTPLTQAEQDQLNSALQYGADPAHPEHAAAIQKNLEYYQNDQDQEEGFKNLDKLFKAHPELRDDALKSASAFPPNPAYQAYFKSRGFTDSDIKGIKYGIKNMTPDQLAQMKQSLATSKDQSLKDIATWSLPHTLPDGTAIAADPEKVEKITKAMQYNNQLGDAVDSRIKELQPAPPAAAPINSGEQQGPMPPPGFKPPAQAAATPPAEPASATTGRPSRQNSLPPPLQQGGQGERTLGPPQDQKTQDTSAQPGGGVQPGQQAAPKVMPNFQNADQMKQWIAANTKPGDTVQNAQGKTIKLDPQTYANWTPPQAPGQQQGQQDQQQAALPPPQPIPVNPPGAGAPGAVGASPTISAGAIAGGAGAGAPGSMQQGQPQGAQQPPSQQQSQPGKAAPQGAIQVPPQAAAQPSAAQTPYLQSVFQRVAGQAQQQPQVSQDMPDLPLQYQVPPPAEE